MIDAFGWRSILVINLPLGALSLVLGWRTVPATQVTPAPLDRTGPVMAAGALVLIAAGLILGGADGWGSPVTVALLAAGVVAAVVFAVAQRSAERRGLHPMVPPSFFHERVRAVSVASAGLMGFAFYGTLLTMSVYYQQARGYSPGGAGLALLPLTAGSAIGPLVAYRPLARRFGHAAMLLSGFACAACGMVVLGTVGTATPYPVACAGLLLVGGASTIAFSALTSLLMTHVPPAQSGLASGLQNTTRQSGALFAVSVFGSVLNTAEPAGRIPTAFVIAGAATVAGISCGAIAIRATRIQSQAATAEKLQVKR
jgi:DHA2 family methylenomycin A resistance protein-like MFS transporter